MEVAQASEKKSRRPVFSVVLMLCLAATLFLPTGCGTLYGIYGLLICRESAVHLTTTIRVRDGHFGMHMWPRRIGDPTFMMIRCDSATARRIQSIHYDRTMGADPDRYSSIRRDPDRDVIKGTTLGQLKMYRKKKLVYETFLFPRPGSMELWSDFEIASMGLDETRVDSLEIVNASPLLDGARAQFIEYHRCMCRRDSGRGEADCIAVAYSLSANGAAF